MTRNEGATKRDLKSRGDIEKKYLCPFGYFLLPILFAPIFAGHPIHATLARPTHPNEPISMGEFACVPCRCTVPRDPKGCSRLSQVSVREGGREEEWEWKGGEREREKRSSRRMGRGRRSFATLGALDPNGGGGTTRTRGRKNRRPAEKDEKNVKKNSR